MSVPPDGIRASPTGLAARLLGLVLSVVASGDVGASLSPVVAVWALSGDGPPGRGRPLSFLTYRSLHE